MQNQIFLQRYRISLGRGNQPIELHRSLGARTFLAQEIETGHDVALTMVAPAPNDASTFELLRAHAAAAKKINHFNILRLYDFGRENQELIYVSEYCEGSTTGAWVRARGPFALSEVLRIALQVTDAMNAAGFDRLYHPALHPENIVIVPGETSNAGDWPPIRILHWFLPAAEISPANREQESMASFASPEQLSGEAVEMPSEIYSLGATMFFLLTGIAPAVDAETQTVARLRGTPKIVSHLLGRMLSAEAADRPQDPVALTSHLQTCLDRVERREKINRRFALPVLPKPRVVEEKEPASAIVAPLAVAVGLLVVIVLTVFFLPGTALRHVAATAAGSAEKGAKLSPNEKRLVIEHPPRDELAKSVVAPQPTAPYLTPNESPPRMAHQPRAPEPAPPAEGPPRAGVTSTSALAERSSETPASIEIRPNELPNDVPEESAVPPPVAQSSSEPPTPSAPAVAVATPPNEKRPASDREAAVERKEAPSPTGKHPVVRRSKRKLMTSRPSTSPRALHPIKRAQPIPDLRVGSSRAELVGTTSDGRWILSVPETGGRVIVPPPPGFNQ